MGAILTDLTYQLVPPLLLVVGTVLVAVRWLARRHGQAAARARLQGPRKPARMRFRSMGYNSCACDSESLPTGDCADTAGHEDPFGLLPTIFRTPGGSVAIDIPMRDIHSTQDLVDAVVQAGVAHVDSDIDVGSIKVHYTTSTRPDGRPTRITQSTKWADVQRMASALIVNPL